MSGDLILEWYCSWKLWLSSVWKSALIKLGYVVSTQLLLFLLMNAFVIELFSILCIVIELFSTHCTCWISCVVHLFNATDFKTYIYIYIYCVCGTAILCFLCFCCLLCFWLFAVFLCFWLHLVVCCLHVKKKKKYLAQIDSLKLDLWNSSFIYLSSTEVFIFYFFYIYK